MTDGRSMVGIMIREVTVSAGEHAIVAFADEDFTPR